MNKVVAILLLLAGFVGSASAQVDSANNPATGLTIPKKNYAAHINFENAPVRKNNKYPLSDQSNKGRWKLLKNDCDEFTDKILNTDRWYPNNPGWKGRKPTFFHESNVLLRDGYAVFSVNKHGEDKLPEGYTHTAGFIVSKKKFLYGYFEARLKPNKSPWVTGFWMTNSSKDWWTEIDICENCPGVKGNEYDLNSNVHVFKAPVDKGNITKHFSRGLKYYVPFNLSDDFHVWGLDWSKEYIRLYIDGVLYREMENDFWHQELKVNFNNESNKWFGALPDDNFLDVEYLVDYFRVWQRK